MQDRNQITPVKKQQDQQQILPQLDQETIDAIINTQLSAVNPIISANGASIIGSNKNTNGLNMSNSKQSINESSILKQIDNQSDTIHCPMNDPIFQPTTSPNFLMEHKNYNPYISQAYNANYMLASIQKPYSNNLFLTPVKEDNKNKPGFINSILKESPYFNGNNICRKLNFDDNIEDFSGNNFMPLSGIFEEKKGIFSNFNINYLLMPQAYNSLYSHQSEFKDNQSANLPKESG